MNTINRGKGEILDIVEIEDGKLVWNVYENTDPNRKFGNATSTKYKGKLLCKTIFDDEYNGLFGLANVFVDLETQKQKLEQMKDSFEELQKPNNEVEFVFPNDKALKIEGVVESKEVEEGKLYFVETENQLYKVYPELSYYVKYNKQ